MTSNGASKIEGRHYINNEYVNSKSEKPFSIYNPADGTLVTDNVQTAGEADVDAAVAAAQAAFKGPWGSFSGAQRAAVMLKWADLAEKKVQEVAYLETVAMGQPNAIAASFIVPMMIKAFRYYAGWADKLSGEQYPADEGTYTIVSHEPLGVCASIAPWNASALYVGWKIAPSLAAGCTHVFKASEKSPLGVTALGPVFAEAGFPPGVVNIINGPGSTGALMASHMGITKISFTGSTATGKKVQELATKSNLKKVTLELGGKSPALIFNDADLENALQFNSQGFLMNTGQVCVATSRTYVQEGIAEKFTEALKARFEGFSAATGDPMAPTTFLGPVADKAQFERVMEYVAEGKKNATLLTGGAQKGTKGYFIEPTIFTNPKEDSRIYNEEIFGPVLMIKTFKTEEEAIELANATKFGLGATIFTTNLNRALRVSRKLESGMVAINSSVGPIIQAPFGGSKQSGQGRESGKEGLMEYLEVKTITINMKIPHED
jgi:aldehyde dehydrogenase (NAD+)